MFRTLKSYAVLLLFSFLLFSSGRADQKNTAAGSNTPTAREIITQMIKAINNVKTLQYNLKVTERIKGKIINSQSSVKLQKAPRKLYLYLKGPEVLWIEGKNNGLALVNPGDFPYINLNLDPYGSVLRKDQHHTIHEVGFDYFGDIIGHGIKKAENKFETTFLYIGEDKCDGRNCYKIIISYPEFTFTNYTVKKRESIVSIAREHKVSEYMMLENNPRIEHYSSVNEGDQIKIPNAYGKLIVLLIDKEYLLPISNKIYDDKGLFEAYEYHNLRVNQKIPDEEFTKAYKGYHF